MYKLLLALALATANQEDAKPSGGLRGLRFASFVNTDKGGPEASACLKAGGDCAKCCGGCNPKDPINDGTDFRGEDECVCFHGTFDSVVNVHLTDHDDCANVVRQGDVRVSIKGEEGTDAIHMSSLGASADLGAFRTGYIYGQEGVDYLTCAGNGHEVYGTDYRDYQADGGNFMSCSGDNNFMRGGGGGDDIFCVGNGCDVDGRAGDDNVYVENPDGPDLANPDVYTPFINGGDGDYDTCTYNGEKVDYDDWDNGDIDGNVGFVGFGCENPLYPRPPICDSPLCPPKKEKGSK